MAYEPKFELAEYRKFIREAAPFVSLVLGRKLKPAEADLLSDTEMVVIAEKIDKRVKDLNANIAANKQNGFGSPRKDEPQDN
ncbi:MAG: hypothetical protein EOP05_09235 [Proteobacteria bacterium]|nr:MAG: hypothetical protein EOP05_09235 [Pseudomonadota bacterium]